MKPKIRETQWSPPGNVHVFLDDLKTMTEILAEVGTVRVETDRWDDADMQALGEMRANPPSSILMTSSLDGTTDEMRVDVSTDHFIAWVRDDTAQLIGALNKVKDVVTPRSRETNRYLAIGVLLVAALAFGGAFFLRPLALEGQVALLAVGFGVLVGGISMTDSKRRRVTIHMYPSFEHSTFLSRNREGIFVNIVVGLVFFVLGIAAGYVLQSLGTS